ncbi:hypothetical protein B0H11DRAFT_17619 [Mycena galericulata]|nr:hypothetical protein B0H11DRAFT_17619 [Mycena galericulata]
MQLAEMRRDGGHRIQDPHDRETTHNLAIPPDLPPAPQIFYGRDNELSSLVGMFSQEGQAHAVLLGQDGTGKSALALALLNRTEIASKFGARRFLVRCDVSAGATDISLRLAEALGLSRIPRHTPPKNAVLSELAAHPFDSLIAFDDLDGAWTSPCTRVALEDLLADLSAIPSLSLLLTLRGFQRPRGPAYTHPFPPPLGPLPLPAARALFRAISDLPPLAGIPAAELVETESSLQDMPTATDTEAPLIDSLLHHARCLPRGVVRLAQCAQYEPLPFLLARCAEEGVV